MRYEYEAPFMPWPDDAEPSRALDVPAPRQPRDMLYRSHDGGGP